MLVPLSVAEGIVRAGSRIFCGSREQARRIIALQDVLKNDSGNRQEIYKYALGSTGYQFTEKLRELAKKGDYSKVESNPSTLSSDAQNLFETLKPNISNTSSEDLDSLSINITSDVYDHFVGKVEKLDIKKEAAAELACQLTESFCKGVAQKEVSFREAYATVEEELECVVANKELTGEMVQGEGVWWNQKTSYCNTPSL